MTWTLKHGATTQTFAQWGLSEPHRRTRNMAPDEVTFVEDGLDFDEEATFEFNDEITIYRDDVQWFVGRMLDPRRVGEATGERVIYRAKGVLSWLDDLVFRQPWKFRSDYANPGSALTTTYLADLVLFQKIVDGASALATVKEQVQEIFDYLISRWDSEAEPGSATAPKLQLDASLLPTHQAPFIEVSNVTCGMALEYALRTCPDIALWVDYSTTPPTAKIGRRASLDAATLTVYAKDENPGTNGNIKVEIQPRNDLKVPAVAIEFRQTNSINGYIIPYVSQDIYPVGADITAFGVIPQVVNLEGSNLSFPQETLAVRAIQKDSADWWKLHETSLARSSVRNLVIRSATRNGSLPNEILPNSGAWAPWMGGSAEEDVIECFASYDIYDTLNGQSIHREKKTDQLLQVRLMTTNLVGGTYQGPVSGTLGEPIPTGIAEALYTAANATHYEGIIVFEEEECSGPVKVGQVVNIVNAKRPEWATMRAFVQEVEEDIENGRTTVTVGPPKFLGVNEIMDWLRGLRRSNSGAWNGRVTGFAYGGGALRMASRAHKETLSAGKEAMERLVLMRPDSQTQTGQTLTAKIILDILDCLGKEIKLREIEVCDNGTTKYMIVLGSEVYAAPLSTS